MAIAKYTITCGGSFPSDRLACRPAAATASSITSRGTDEARTPSETRSVHRLPATTPAFCAMHQDHPGQPPGRGNNTTHKQDQLTVSGIDARPVVHSTANPQHRTLANLYEPPIIALSGVVDLLNDLLDHLAIYLTMCGYLICAVLASQAKFYSR